MLDQVKRVEDGRDAVLELAGDNPYTRAMTGLGPVVAYLAGPVVAWVGPGLWGPVACTVGPAVPAVRLLGALRAAGALRDLRWLHTPRSATAELSAHLPVDRIFQWDFRWLDGHAPAEHPAADRVVPLGEADEPQITALLDAALPESSARPGSPLVNHWYGIRDADGTLLACAADESRGGIGFLGGIAVAPERQGRGLGAALTVTLTRRLAAEHDAVALGVMSDNPRAAGLYERLGFTGVIRRTTVVLA